MPHAVTRPVCTFCRTWPAPPHRWLRWASSINVPDPLRGRKRTGQVSHRPWRLGTCVLYCAQVCMAHPIICRSCEGVSLINLLLKGIGSKVQGKVSKSTDHSWDSEEDTQPTLKVIDFSYSLSLLFKLDQLYIVYRVFLITVEYIDVWTNQWYWSMILDQLACECMEMLNVFCFKC